MVGLEYAILVWSELLEFLLEELRFLVCNGFLVEDEDVADIVIVDLRFQVSI